MGEVWRGLHRAQQVPVAIKIVSPERAVQDRFRSAFRNEVQAVARLNHPAVVMVLDYGEIPKSVETATQGRLCETTPYLVMELLQGGALSDRDLPGGWPELRDTLLAILDGLAFAHARGVLHRDLSIRNVMWGAPADLRPGLKLIDFGLAALEDLGEDPSRRLAAGTPAFQAPEQIASWRARSQGPWTDLYAVGCLAYYLCCGVPPFRGATNEEMARLHLTAPPPTLKPRIAVPDHLDRWVRRMLQKEPERRFRSAADAAWNLMHGETGRLRTPSTPLPAIDMLLDTTSSTSPVQMTPLVTLSTVAEPEGGEVLQRLPIPIYDEDPTLPEIAPTPLPGDWRRTVAPPQPVQLLGAGLNLYGLRAIPLVGRELERDLIWDVLMQVARGEGARAIVLRGAAGCGKTRLAQWIAERAHELGCPAVLKATHEPVPAAGSGLVPMLARHLKCGGLDRFQMGGRLDEHFPTPRVLDHLEVRSLRDMLASEGGTESGEASLPQFRGSGERHHLVHRVLRELSQGRMAVVILDDVQWGPDALDLVRHVLTARDLRTSRILFLLTARDEALSEAPRASQLLDQLLESGHARELPLEALDDTSHARLIEGLLLFDEGLARTLSERTGGNPLFAVHLVDDWIRRGILEVRDTGFHLKDGAQASFPDSLHEVWNDRIDRLIEDGVRLTGLGAESVGVALELAGTLGQSVDRREWTSACQDAGLTAVDPLIDLLVTSRLASRQDDQWSFAHGMVRESLQRRADDAGRLVRHHQRCASVLSTMGGPRLPERLGRHHLAAGNLPEAVARMLEAAEARALGGDLDRAREILDEREAVLDRLSIRADDVRRARGWVEYARVFTRLQRVDEAEAYAEQAVDSARQFFWPDLEAHALLWRARGCNARGAFDQGVEHGLAGRQLAATLGDTRLRAELCDTLSNLYVSMASLDRAERYASEALQLARKIGNRLLEGMAYSKLGNIARNRGNHREALQFYGRTPPIFEDVGDAWQLAIATNNLADMARILGDLDAALTGYKRALTLFQRISSDSATWVRLNIALVHIARRDYDAAEPVLERALEAFEAMGSVHFTGIAHVFRLPGLADRGELEAWDATLAKASELLAEAKLYDPDIAEVAEHAASILERDGNKDRARAAYGLAVNQWEAMVRPDDVARVGGRVAALDE